MKFKRALLTCFTLLIGIGIWEVYSLTILSDQDKELYQELTQENPSHSDNRNCLAEQNRLGTTKTLLLNSGNDRKIGIIKSHESHLVYKQEGAFQELTEEMQRVDMIYQEELLLQKDGSPIQIILALQADKAIYFYKQQKWVADKVFIQRYKLPGHEFPSVFVPNPFFQGTADQITFDMSQEPAMLHTNGLKATFVRD